MKPDCFDPSKSRLYEQLNNTFELNGDCADVCSVQDSKFNTIFVVAITTYEIATAFYGLLFDTIGTGYTRILKRFFKYFIQAKFVPSVEPWIVQ